MIKVSVVVPCRNEVNYLEGFVHNVFRQQLDGIALDVFIADGMSNDGTRDLFPYLSNHYSVLTFIDNPRKTVSAGLNRCIRLSRADIIVRMDVHTIYAQDYISACVAALNSTGASCVGGPWIAQGNTPIQKAIASAFQSPIASGGAASRFSSFCGHVDTVYLGTWARSTLLALGGFDEEMVRNQDDELSLRLIRAGGSIWQSPNIKSFYTPRSSYSSLYRQYLQYGYWKLLGIKKHRIPSSLRHLAPVFLLLSLILSSSLAVLFPVSGLVFILLACSYCFLLFVDICTRKPSYPVRVIFAIIVMHTAYAHGSLFGFLDFFCFCRPPASSMSALTR
jgi:succinoglycan biosynthesis protein ExoA